MRVSSPAVGRIPWWVFGAGEGVTARRNRESAFGGVKPWARAIVPSHPVLSGMRNGLRQPAPPSLPLQPKVFGCGSRSRHECRTGQAAFVQRDSVAQIVQSIERGIERWHARNEVGARTAPANGAGTGSGSSRTRRPATSRSSGARTGDGGAGRSGTATGRGRQRRALSSTAVPYPYPSGTRVRRSWTILRPAGSPDRPATASGLSRRRRPPRRTYVLRRFRLGIP